MTVPARVSLCSTILMLTCPAPPVIAGIESCSLGCVAVARVELEVKPCLLSLLKKNREQGAVLIDFKQDLEELTRRELRYMNNFPFKREGVPHTALATRVRFCTRNLGANIAVCLLTHESLAILFHQPPYGGAAVLALREENMPTCRIVQPRLDLTKPNTHELRTKGMRDGARLPLVPRHDQRKREY